MVSIPILILFTSTSRWIVSKLNSRWTEPKSFSGALLCDVLFNSNIVSQRVVDELDNLKQKLIDYSANPDQKMLLEGKVFSEEHGRQKVLHDLSRFSGYHGGGFFTLGKSLLTTLTSNFATYLIILIQFKISEQSSNSNCKCGNETDFINWCE